MDSEMRQASIDNNDRIDELEARLAQQDQSIIELSDEVYRQQRQIEALEIEVRHLAERLRETVTSEPDGNPADEVPPHY